MDKNQYKNTPEADEFLTVVYSSSDPKADPQTWGTPWFKQVVIGASRGNDYSCNADAAADGAIYALHSEPLRSWEEISRLIEGLKQCLYIEGIGEALQGYCFSIAITTREGVELVLLNDVSHDYVLPVIVAAEGWQDGLAEFDSNTQAEWRERESVTDTLVQEIRGVLPEELGDRFWDVWLDVSGYLCDKYRFDA